MMGPRYRAKGGGVEREQLAVYLPADAARVVRLLAAAERRSPSNMGAVLIVEALHARRDAASGARREAE